MEITKTIRYTIRRMIGRYRYGKIVRRTDSLKILFGMDFTSYIEENGTVIVTSSEYYMEMEFLKGHTNFSNKIYATEDCNFYRDLQKKVFLEKYATGNVK